MAVTPTCYPKTVTWDTNTWDKSDEGTLGMRVVHDANQLADRTGDAAYPTSLLYPEKTLQASVRLRNFRQTLAPGDGPSDMVITVSDGTNDYDVTLKTMVFDNVTMGQDYGALGESELMFSHESADGTTNPVTTS